MQLCFNIWPQAKTILHKLAENDEKDNAKSGAQYTDDQAAKDLFHMAKRGLSYSTPFFEKGEPFEIPIFEDMYGNTAIDNALGLAEGKGWTLSFKRKKKVVKAKVDAEKQPKTDMNMQLALVILQEIKDYSIYHSGPYLVEAVTKAVRVNVPGIADYLDMRVRPYTGNDISIMQTEVKDSAIATIDCSAYGCHPLYIVGDADVFCSKLFTGEGPKKQMKLELFDIPEIYANTEAGRDFIRALSSNEDIAIFHSPIVQRLVNHHWIKTKSIVYWASFVPLCIQLVIFMSWNSYVIEHRLDSENYQLA